MLSEQRQSIANFAALQLRTIRVAVDSALDSVADQKMSVFLEEKYEEASMLLLRAAEVLEMAGRAEAENQRQRKVLDQQLNASIRLVASVGPEGARLARLK